MMKMFWEASFALNEKYRVFNRVPLLSPDYGQSMGDHGLILLLSKG